MDHSNSLSTHGKPVVTVGCLIIGMGLSVIIIIDVIRTQKGGGKKTMLYEQFKCSIMLPPEEMSHPLGRTSM